MRIVLGFGKRMWVFENTSKLVKVDIEEGSSDEEAAEHVSIDPHGSVMCSTEVAPSSVDLHNWRFGFCAPIQAVNNGSEG